MPTARASTRACHPHREDVRPALLRSHTQRHTAPASVALVTREYAIAQNTTPTDVPPAAANLSVMKYVPKHRPEIAPSQRVRRVGLVADGAAAISQMETMAARNPSS